MKEHVLITIFANAGAGSVYAIHIITVVKAYYMKNMTFFVSFIVIVTTQVRIFKLSISLPKKKSLELDRIIVSDRLRVISV